MSSDGAGRQDAHRIADQARRHGRDVRCRADAAERAHLLADLAARREQAAAWQRRYGTAGDAATDQSPPGPDGHLEDTAPPEPA